MSDDRGPKYLVYEMFKGHLVGIHWSMQDALDQAHRTAHDVPDEAGLLVATCRAMRTPPTQIDDADDLARLGYGILWRVTR